MLSHFCVCVGFKILKGPVKVETVIVRRRLREAFSLTDVFGGDAVIGGGLFSLAAAPYYSVIGKSPRKSERRKTQQRSSMKKDLKEKEKAVRNIRYFANGTFRISWKMLSSSRENLVSFR